jgi:hypothetical protein
MENSAARDWLPFRKNPAVVGPGPVSMMIAAVAGGPIPKQVKSKAAASWFFIYRSVIYALSFVFV